MLPFGSKRPSVRNRHIADRSPARPERTLIRWTYLSITQDVLDQFTPGTRTDRVGFVVNDSVRTVSGTNKKRSGTIVSIFSLDPVTTYMIEPNSEPWGDFQAGEADLELVEEP